MPHIGLVNLIADKRIAPELIQQDASPAGIAAHVLALLNNLHHMDRMKGALAEVTRRLGNSGASEKVATIAWGLIAKGPTCSSGNPPEKDHYGA